VKSLVKNKNLQENFDEIHKNSNQKTYTEIKFRLVKASLFIRFYLSNRFMCKMRGSEVETFIRGVI
jgi:hypothetical protein